MVATLASPCLHPLPTFYFKPTTQKEPTHYYRSRKQQLQTCVGKEPSNTRMSTTGSWLGWRHSITSTGKSTALRSLCHTHTLSFSLTSPEEDLRTTTEARSAGGTNTKNFCSFPTLQNSNKQNDPQSRASPRFTAPRSSQSLQTCHGSWWM